MLGHREDWGKELPSQNSLFWRKSWKKFEKLFLEEMKEVIQILNRMCLIVILFLQLQNLCKQCSVKYPSDDLCQWTVSEGGLDEGLLSII